MTGRRHFGTVRKRSSGKWQAQYWHEARYHSAGVFPTKADALASLSVIEADVRRGAWIDPRGGESTLRLYAEEWLSRRPELADRTRELYQHIFERHVFPSLGSITLAKLAPSKIRGWHADIAQSHPATAAKAYRLLSSVMRTAVVDGLILASPCKVDGAGTERAAERPIATIAEVEALANAMPEHLRLIVPLATWCQLRRGEILGLRRKDVDLLHATIHIEQSRTFAMDGRSIVKQPKTAAGRRKLVVPEFVLTMAANHLERFTGADPEALVFMGRGGVPLTQNALQGSWKRSRLSVGRTDLRLHDLRHTGLTIAAATGATTAELMHRAGHSSTPAALRYQHATQNRDRILADALQELVVPSHVVPIESASKGKV